MNRRTETGTMGRMAGRRSKKRPWGAPHVELDADRARGGRSTTSRRGNEWTVQHVKSSERTFTCPGCNQVIVVGTPHVVAWVNDSIFGAQAGLADRRHWHGGCWDRAH